MNGLAQFWRNASLRSSHHLRPNQAIHWYAIRYWRAHGMETFDWGGEGTYKEKYGGQKVLVHRFCNSRLPMLPTLREQARRLFMYKQRVKGWLVGSPDKPSQEKKPTRPFEL